ncbi:elongation of very long chain fatty acids protein AAEL008004-like [Diprion similis]|uniref:elongation of very long chain fatty acids protein AAEL008004-like n=1 Tax=Diprion similis TaxID=362088 RepID=UPI001EF904F1|nr:elongation of very long chain fatty acids protein AAEL008004-like [Diprion similis]
MDQVVRMVVDAYRDLMDNKSDPRVNGWFMMSGPMPTALICITYAYCVKVLGPKLMENRKPMKLRKVLIFYNLFQVIFSYWLFKESLVAGWGGHYSFRCQPVDYSNNTLALRMAHACWWYYISKFTEFFDTIFFVLRKKNEQVSTLHVIHHGIMPMSVWFGLKFTPGGHSTFFGLLNTFVHIVMYSYYLLAALGPHMQPYLWWKKYLTTLQMVQFVLVMVHAFQLLFIQCNYPKAFVWWIGMHAVLFYFLFRDFYQQAYVKKSRNVARTDDSNDAKLQNGKVQDGEGILKNGLQLGADNKDEIYAGKYKMATGYISGNGLRNRVFIDNRSISE